MGEFRLADDSTQQIQRGFDIAVLRGIYGQFVESARYPTPPEQLAALGSEKETMVFLSTEGVRVSQKGYVDDVHEEGFMPLKELMDVFAEGGGTIYVCAPCFKKRGLDENNLVDGAVMVGGAKLVEFLSDGTPSVTY